MTRRLLPMSLLLATAACAHAQHTPAGGPTAETPGAQQCDAAPAQDFVGKDASADAVAEIVRVTHSANSRVLGPNSAMTMDYRMDRVNIVVDKDNRIERIHCG